MQQNINFLKQHDSQNHSKRTTFHREMYGMQATENTKISTVFMLQN